MGALANVLGLIAVVSLIVIVLAFFHTKGWFHLISVKVGKRNQFDDYSEDISHLTVVIPARNEEDRIGRTIKTLLAQNVGRIIVVNDHSTDDTSLASRDAAFESNRPDAVHIITPPSLPTGWRGKCWAMHCGLEEVDTELVLFCDADVVHKQGSLSMILSFYHRYDLDFASFFTKFDCKTVFGKMISSALMFAFVMIYPMVDILNTSKSTASAAGMVMLAKTTTVRNIGGFKSVSDTVVEDVAFSRVLKRNGSRIGMALTTSIMMECEDEAGTPLNMVKRGAAPILGKISFPLAASLLICGAITVGGICFYVSIACFNVVFGDGDLYTVFLLFLFIWSIILHMR
ncbi:hypothetical protein PCE1_000049 [Barthelona sp. PCE]